MNLFSLIIVVIALSSEAFSGIYLNGFLKESGVSLDKKARVILYVTVANIVMAALGFFIGEILSAILSDFSTSLSIGIIFIVGLKMIIKAFQPKFREMTWELTNQKVLLGFSFALGVNVFLLGLALPALQVTISSFITIVLSVFISTSFLALIFGKTGTKFLVASRLILGGGILVVGIAVYFIIQNFNLI